MNKTVTYHVQNQISSADQAVVVYYPVGHVTVNQIVLTEVMKIQIFAVSFLYKRISFTPNRI